MCVETLHVTSLSYSLLRGSDGERGSDAEVSSASTRLETSPSACFPTPYSLNHAKSNYRPSKDGT